MATKIGEKSNEFEEVKNLDWFFGGEFPNWPWEMARLNFVMWKP